MRKLILFLLVVTNIYSQKYPDRFDFTGKYKVTEGPKSLQGTYNDLNTVVVIKTPFSVEGMYKKTVAWLNEYYQNPEEVFEGKIENEYIRFRGSTTEPISYAPLYNMPYARSRYQIEVRFKDERLRLEIISLEYYLKSTSAYISSGWKPLSFKHRIQKRNGNDVGYGLNSIIGQKKYFNKLLDEYTTYLKEGSKVDDDW